ncbi:hypothetical protein FQA39_LY09979 [Lamprigera yunnana]|nr:hypothetical protein FQA39_LY09979 [Lamprigera yunnana]
MISPAIRAVYGRKVVGISDPKYNINDLKTGDCETMLLNQTIYYLNKSKSKWISVGLYYPFKFASVVKIFGRSKQYFIFKEEKWIQFYEKRENIKYFQTCDMMWKPRKIVSKTLTFDMIEEKKILRIEDMCGNEVYLGYESVSEVWSLETSIPEEYDANNEDRLLRHGNAAEETLINSTRYDLDNECKYVEIGYITHLDLQPIIRVRDGATGCADFQCNVHFSKNNVLLDTYEWQKFTELEPHMINQFYYDSSEIQRVLIEYSKDELSIRDMCKTNDITDDVTISYH